MQNAHPPHILVDEHFAQGRGEWGPCGRPANNEAIPPQDD
jgi:hypothetical protein